MDNQRFLICKLQMVSDILQSDKIIESFSMFPDNIETIFQIIEELESKIPMIKGFSKEEFKSDITLYDISNKAKDFIKYKYSCLIREEKINEILKCVQ
jgi:hypothetical protein